MTPKSSFRMIRVTTAARPRLKALLTVAALLVTACADSITERDLAGNAVPANPAPFVLATINGQVLPVEMRRDTSGRVSITQGELMLGGSTFWQRLTLLETPPSGIGVSRTTITQGTITVSGTRVHFRANDGGEWDGTASPGWIVYTVPGNSAPVTFAFRQG
jgi:hypothetical protein